MFMNADAKTTFNAARQKTNMTLNRYVLSMQKRRRSYKEDKDFSRRIIGVRMASFANAENEVKMVSAEGRPHLLTHHSLTLEPAHAPMHAICRLRKMSEQSGSQEGQD